MRFNYDYTENIENNEKKFNAVTEFGFLSVTLPVLVLILEIL